MKKILRIGIPVLAVVIIAAVVAAVLLLGNQPGLPRSVTRSANFTLYYPDTGGDWQIDRPTIDFNKSGQVLTYTLRSSNNRMVLTQQQRPDAFDDVPHYYDTLLNKLNEYDEISTAVGKVALTRPKELNGGQSAVSNTSKGTLIFAHPDHELSAGEWKTFFNQLRLED
jgi:hypothetical protein